MKNTLKDLEKRMAALEKHLRPPRAPGLILIQPLEPAKRASLKPGQRIVKDLYLDAAGKTVMTSERITGKPSDLGKLFPDGTWDSTRLDEWDPSEPIRIFWDEEEELVTAPPPPASSEKPKSEAPKSDLELELPNPESEATQNLAKLYDPLDFDDGADDDEDPKPYPPLDLDNGMDDDELDLPDS